MSIRRARPRPRHSRFVTVGLATLASCAAVAVTASPADASILSPGKSITLKDGIVTARCSMSVQSVDASGLTENVRIGLSAQPTYLTGYFDNTFTAVSCSVVTPTADPQYPTYLANYTIQKNGPTIPSTSNVATIPVSTPLQLCAFALVVLKDGSIHSFVQQCV